MAPHSILDIAGFRAAFPAFASSSVFPDVMLNMYFSVAANFIDNTDNAYGFHGGQLDYVLWLVTAHLLFLARQAQQQAGTGGTGTGKNIGFTTSASVGDISVNVAPPPTKNLYQSWLVTSPYGQQFYALAQAACAGGISVGGSPESSAFRRCGGGFY